MHSFEDLKILEERNLLYRKRMMEACLLSDLIHVVWLYDITIEFCNIYG